MVKDVFHIGINQNNTLKCGYQVLPKFTVTQHKRDIQVLHALKKIFLDVVLYE